MGSTANPVWMRARRSPGLAFAGVSAALLFVLFLTFWHSAKTPAALPVAPNAPDSSSNNEGEWRFNVAKDARNLGLSPEQCDAAFPKLYSELDRARDHWGRNSISQDMVKIRYDEKAKKQYNQVQVLIHNGQMYIIDEVKGDCDRQRGFAGLSNLYRAITSMPDPSALPNIEFTLNVEDGPFWGLEKDRVQWGWTRKLADKDMNVWVAPDFDGWAYAVPDLGSYVSFREKLPFFEKPFHEKNPRAVWRGAVNSDLRKSLVSATKEKTWADVGEMAERLHMAQFCQYQFPVHTEGNTWSGRLRYLNNCNSTVFVHELEYQAHYYDLLVSEGPEQNYVKVKRDFSDLESKVQQMISNPAEAQRIAHNAAMTFRDRYLTPAAEACYWRRMVRNWAEVQAFEPKAYEEVKQKDGSIFHKQRGVDFEIWIHPDNNHPVKLPHFEGV